MGRADNIDSTGCHNGILDYTGRKFLPQWLQVFADNFRQAEKLIYESARDIQSMNKIVIFFTWELHAETLLTILLLKCEWTCWHNVRYFLIKFVQFSDVFGEWVCMLKVCWAERWAGGHTTMCWWKTSLSSHQLFSWRELKNYSPVLIISYFGILEPFAKWVKQTKNWKVPNQKPKKCQSCFVHCQPQ